MAELTTKDRLQPSLLDRLCDDEPDKLQEPLERRVLTLARLRECVLRDLNWLFNATQLSASEDLTNCPFVVHSVINYGIPPLSGATVARVDLRAMEQALRQSILDFEPRLLADSVRVRAKVGEDVVSLHNVLSFDIECRLWAQPAPLALLLRSNIDLESGQTSVQEIGSG